MSRLGSAVAILGSVLDLARDGRLPDEATAEDAAVLLDTARDLAAARAIDEVAPVVRRAARRLTRADGVTFVLREGDLVHYVDEEAIAPLWKGSRFPAACCISGWAMIHARSVVIEDVFLDERIPKELYRSTFVRSLAMIPVRPEAPVAAIGAYWAERHRADAREVALLEAVAGLASTALANAALWAELRDAVRSRDEFLVEASHELRTPLAPIKLRLESALRRIDAGRPVGEVRGAIADASRQLERLEEIAEEMLDAVHFAGHRVELVREDVELGALVREAAARFEAAGRGAIRVRADAPVTAQVDRRRTGDVLDHLLSNAAKFGGGLPVEVSVEAREGLARIEVRDGGMGIAPEDQARIFERFERAASVRDFDGLGLGLWLVREIVRAHGGRVEVASRPGAGATFSVLLPLRAPQLP